ncbi:MAG: hypothetical protein KDI29_06265 [Pseudomonadales bacterium]|nr:hypothetical protein [Pseudomonadales bacterium]
MLKMKCDDRPLRRAGVRRRCCCASLCLAILAFSPTGRADDNQDLRNNIIALIGTHNLALPVSLTPAPGVSDAAELVTYGTNIALKYIRAPFTAPADLGVMPNSADQCYYRMTLPQSEAEYKNLLGIWDILPLVSNWGPLGSPTVSHANTDVTVSVSSLGPVQLARTNQSQTVLFPAGNHYFQWQAETQISPLFDIVMPVVIYGITNVKYGKSVTSLGDDSAAQAARQATFQEQINETLANIAIEAGLTLIDYSTDTGVVSVINARPEHIQRFSVFDVRDPLIATTAPVLILEATDFGGTSYQRVKDQLFDTISASDPCGRDYSLSSDAPVLFPLGTSTLTWTVRDLGPNPAYQSNSATLQQTIVVEDSQAPIMVPPAGRVIESPGAGLNREEIDLGVPLVVDLADSKPLVSNDSPVYFPVNSRTEVIWRAVDFSGNMTDRSQLITVKQPGTNTAPVATPATVNTLTARPVDIVLTGNDADIVDDRTDPLSFRIVQQPEHGQFIAPLYPFFIEDYRTRPEGPFGEGFLTASPRSKWVFQNYCSPDRIRWDAVFEPIYLHVTDDGTQYIFDHYWTCNVSSSVGQVNPRVSKWDRDGNYLGQVSMNSNTLEQFVLDRDGHIYFSDRVGSGSSTDLFLKRCSTDFGTNSTQCDTSWKFNYGSAPQISPGSLVYARVDSQQGIVFVTDKRRVFVFDIRDGGGANEYLGALMDGEQFLTSCTAVNSRSGFTIEIDSDSNLYVADSCADKIHKFGPSLFNDSEVFVPGEYVGWLGKCDSSSNNACDETRQRSKGYSCTDTTCFVTTGSDGDGQGQFSTPLHLALDPNDILYVADYANRRIQRFAPDGSFAGEAISTGTGINQGTEPGFLLGNFDSPKTVSVNSTRFYIVDQAESFVHVFETSPLKDISDSSATVTYVSDFAFHSDTDSFLFRASDGLASSEAAQIAINVARNYRPPEAYPASFSGLEDQVVDIGLTADDPDGVIGSDDVNPLDVLTYEIVEAPLHGTLTGTGASYQYQPDSDFHGTDSFTFIADDGVLSSSAATIELQITGVNDPPKLELLGLESAATGFNFSLLASFYDDEIKPQLVEQHFVSINWGDGTSSQRGPLDEGKALVVAPVNEGSPGVITANHVFQSPGTRTVTVCVTDDLGAQGCQSAQISVSNLASLALDVIASADLVSAGDEVSYGVEVTNLAPTVGAAAISADSVQVTHQLPAGLTLMDFSVSDGECTAVASLLTCELGSLQPGASELIQLKALNQGTLFQNVDDDFNVVAMTSSPATREFYLGYVLTSVLADSIDSDNDGLSDGYELANGLNPASDDALLDRDADGLNNLAEFQAGTRANDDDSDDDGMPDGWETDNGLNPLLADDDLDADDDGFSNGDEYLADRDPQTDELTGDRLVPTLAVYDDGILTVPAVHVGADFLDLVIELRGIEPVIFELTDFRLRNIRIPVPRENGFDLANAVLNIPAASVLGGLYTLQFKLVSDSPILLQLVAIANAEVEP